MVWTLEDVERLYTVSLCKQKSRLAVFDIC